MQKPDKTSQIFKSLFAFLDELKGKDQKTYESLMFYLNHDLDSFMAFINILDKEKENE